MPAHYLTDDACARHKKERRALWDLLHTLADAGITPHAVDDGGDVPVQVESVESAFDAVCAVDDARVYFTDGDVVVWVWIVFGNAPHEIACDYSANSEALNAAIETLEGYEE